MHTQSANASDNNAGSTAHGNHGQNCWNTGCDGNLTCFVKFKGEKGGYAQCLTSCPQGWNCETRLPGRCGPSPLATELKPPSLEARALLARHNVSICDRRSPPAGTHPTFTMECYDGGFTGNRYMMVKHMLVRAICCAGVAMLPPSFDEMPESGVSCLDYRMLRPHSLGAQQTAICASSSADSATWWMKATKQTPATCMDDAGITLARLSASLYAGFGETGTQVLGAQCPEYLQRRDTVVMQIRSGDIFTAWKDGERTFNHSGYNSEMSSRGQPPLGFYMRVMEHLLPKPPQPAGTAVLVTSPDRANPVVKALSYYGQLGALRYHIVESASPRFVDDLRVMLCARNLIFAASTLSNLFVDSPRLERSYVFNDKCIHHSTQHLPDCFSAPSFCTPNVTAQGISCSSQRPVSRWCVHPEHHDYSVLQRWQNSDKQQVEMLLGGNASVPLPQCKLAK